MRILAYTSPARGHLSPLVPILEVSVPPAEPARHDPH
jgi:hypothetical protein